MSEEKSEAIDVPDKPPARAEEERRGTDGSAPGAADAVPQDAVPREERRAVPEDDAPSGAPDVVFDALWKRVVENWDDDKPHQAILKFAIDTERMPDLAGRYRKLRDDPDRAARAQKKIDGIVIAATQMLMSMKTPPRTKTPWQWTVSVAFVCLVVLTWLSYKVLVRH